MKISSVVLFIAMCASSVFAAEELSLKTCNDTNSAVFSVSSEDYRIDYTYLNENEVKTEEVLLAGTITRRALIVGEDLKEMSESLKDSEMTENDLQGATYFELDSKYGLYVVTEVSGNTHSFLVKQQSEDDPIYFGSMNSCK